MSDAVLKVLVLGDCATGKTSIIKRYCHSLFSSHHKTTIGVDFALKQLKVDGRSVRLQLWDIAGQDRFGAIARVYYKDALGALLVMDLSRDVQESLDSALAWKEEIDNKVLLPNGKPLPVLLVANKCDLESAAISGADKALLDAFVEEKGFIGWIKTSAKLNTNVSKCAQKIVLEILSHDDVVVSNQSPRSSEIELKSKADNSGGGGGCC